jgi:DNA-binding CsgD family transcriptional regulator
MKAATARPGHAVPPSLGNPILDAVIENLPGNVYRRIRRPDGRYAFEFLSSGLFRHFGIDHERLMREDTIRFDWIHPEDRDRFVADLELSAATLSLLDHRVRVIGAGQRVFWARGIARPYRRADGCIVWDGIVIDVTREVEAEAALRTAKEEMERTQAGVARAFAELCAFVASPLASLALLERSLPARAEPELAAAVTRCRAGLEGLVARLQGAGAAEAAGAAAVPEAPQRPMLTRRQAQVADLLRAGLSNKVIAQRLGITLGTARLHVAAVLRALDVPNRRALRVKP